MSSLVIAALMLPRAFRRLMRVKIAAAIAKTTTTPATTAPAMAPGERELLVVESEPVPAGVEGVELAWVEAVSVAVTKSSLFQLI